MSAVVHGGARKRRWWLALLLNFLLPTAGYAYVGRWRTAWLAAGLLGLLAVLLVEWSLNQPPGLFAYARSRAPTAVETALGWSVSLVVAVHAAWLAGRSPPKSGSRLLHAATYLGPIMALLVGAGLFRAFWPQSTYSTASASMEPTLRVGDVFAVSGPRALCGHVVPQRGDVVIDRHPGSAARYVQRIVAGPGQTVALTNGALSVDGKAISRKLVDQVSPRLAIVEERLPTGRTYRTTDFGPDGPLDNLAPIKIAPGHWYALGDSRDNAADSRVYGPVSSKDICGVAVKILDSKDQSRVGQQP